MKKNIFIISLLLTISITFTGCFGSIFYEIMNDVKPEEATITGTIRSIARYTVNGKEFLVTISEGGIKYKPVDSYDTVSPEYSKHGCWKDLSKNPEGFSFIKYDYYGQEDFVGNQMLKIISDDNYLYLVTAEYTKESEDGVVIPKKIHLFSVKITSLKNNDTWDESDIVWNEIKTEDSDNNELLPIFYYEGYTYSAFNIFSTNSVQTAHRKAYVRSGGTSAVETLSEKKFADLKQKVIETYKRDYTIPVYYELSGTEVKVFSAENLDKDASLSYGFNSAVWFDGDVKFFNTIAAESNETYVKDATMIYFGNDKKLFYYDGTEIAEALADCKNNNQISCLSVCADCLLIGRASYSSTSTTGSGGISKTSLSKEGIPGANTVSFDTNAEIKLKTAYYILTLLNEDPGKNELDSNIFASISFSGNGNANNATFENIGLWSYYPSRGNWNRE